MNLITIWQAMRKPKLLLAVRKGTTMLTPKQFTFDITAPAELAAGRRGFEDRVTVIVDSGDPGGDGDEFAVYLRQSLGEWFDAYVALNEDAPSVRLQAEWDALAADLAATLDKLAKVEEIAFALGAMEDPPCFVCGYNGPDYFQPGTHPCAQRHHEARRIERLRRQREGE